jgi:hypothetical protein
MFLVFVKILGSALSGDELHLTSDRRGFLPSSSRATNENAVEDGVPVVRVVSAQDGVREHCLSADREKTRTRSMRSRT